MLKIIENHKTMVQIKSLTKKYNNKEVVSNISLNINQGEIHGILGPNGAGKTTTLECMEGIRKPDQGEIIISGFNSQKQEKEIRKLLGIQLQVSSLPENILPYEAMKLVCSHHKISVRYDLLERFGLAELRKKEYRQMSTGQKRRLHLALALSNNPELIILDEPTAGLDIQGRSELHRAIRELKDQGKTIILATHDMAEAESLCDRISILIKGRIAKTGTPAEITAAARNESRIQIKTVNNSLLQNPTIKSGKANFQNQSDDYGLWFSNNTSTDLMSLLEEIEKNNDQVVDLRVSKPSLEEAFLDLIEGGTAS